MHFRDRKEAGQLLASQLETYKEKDVVVYALPRGGVVTASEVAKYLNAPLDLIITRKIGHPYHLEYAMAAIAEDGHIIGRKHELEIVDKEWLKQEMEEQRLEAKRRREKYLLGKTEVPVAGKIAILVDDGIATGLTIRMGIVELKHKHPQKIIIAVPIIPQSTASLLKKEADEVISLNIPSDNTFLGAVGAYYEDFSQVTDEEVLAILKTYDKNPVSQMQAGSTSKNKKEKSINSKALSINLQSKTEKELFKWLLACLLFGKPIQQKVAQTTYFEFIKAGLVTPEAILAAGWEKLVSVLDKGHYVRYDYSTATKLLTISKELKQKYGSVTKLIKQSKTANELSKHLQELKGIGPVTASIFLRDVYGLYY